MNPVDIKTVLEKAVLLVDTREQDTPALHRRLELIGLPHKREKLFSGDYSIASDIDGMEITLSNTAAVERKMSLDELAMCFGTERKRFVRKFERAKEIGMRIYMLVENASYENLYNHRYRSMLSPNAFTASLFAWMTRYDCRIIFCKEETAPKVIHDILYRELKERLERGDFE